MKQIPFSRYATQCINIVRCLRDDKIAGERNCNLASGKQQKDTFAIALHLCMNVDVNVKTQKMSCRAAKMQVKADGLSPE